MSEFATRLNIALENSHRTQRELAALQDVLCVLINI